MNFSTPTSNELNIFDSSDSKYKIRPNFFRTLTKTNCEINIEENRRLNEKTISYFKRTNSNNLKDTLSGDNSIQNIIVEENKEVISPFKSHRNKIHFKLEKTLSNKHKQDLNDLEQESFILFEKLFSGYADNYPDMNILEKNKRKYSNLTPVNFLYLKF